MNNLTEINDLLNLYNEVSVLNKSIDEIFIYDDVKISEILNESLNLKEKELNGTITENDKK